MIKGSSAKTVKMMVALLFMEAVTIASDLLLSYYFAMHILRSIP